MRVYPSITAADPSHLVCVPRPLIPVLCGALHELEQREAWASDDDWRQGYTWITELQAELMTGCVDRIVEGQERLYRLLDTALNGTVYTVTPAQSPPPALPADPTRPTITPKIPDAPTAVSPATQPPYGVRKRLERLINLVDNLATGQQYPVEPMVISENALQDPDGLRKVVRDMQGSYGGGWFGIGSRPATLADIANAMKGANDADKQRVLNVVDALVAGSSSATIFNTIKGLFMDGEELITDGAVLGTMIATAIAQAAMLGSMAGQIDRLIASIDGGGLSGPADNVLKALRGTELASETRNVIDAAGAGNLAQLVDEIEGLLIQIRDKVQ